MSQPAPHPVSSAASADRFLPFAFAAADLLVETGPDSKIVWAAGAFASRFGRAAETFLGVPIEELVAPPDRTILAHALAQAALRGRLAPIVLRLNDTRTTHCAIGALAQPGQAGRLCLTFSSLPAEAVVPSSVAPPPARAALLLQGEASLRAGQSKTLNLLDVAGWPAAMGRGSEADRKALRADIMEALVELGGPGVLVGEVGQGRFGVLSGQEVDVQALVSSLQGLLQAAGGGGVRVDGQALPLSLEGLTPGQATRGLRFAVSRFAEGGLAAVSAAGFARGLAGFINDAGGKAAAVRGRIAARKFNLVYQPVVGLGDRKAHHFEALLRPLTAADGPTQSAQDFVTFVGAMGLSEELDFAVTEAALVALRETEWAHVAVNISGLSMQSPRFQERLLALIGEQSRLTVELTETADITDTPAVAAMLDALRGRGVPVCIDDFGTGSAAFRYLRDFRVDFVKIDGAYVQAAMAGPRERGIVVSMCDLARAVDAAVIAEMVETEQQASLMAEIGVEFGQGYLFGRPGPLPGHRR